MLKEEKERKRKKKGKERKKEKKKKCSSPSLFQCPDQIFFWILKHV